MSALHRRPLKYVIVHPTTGDRASATSMRAAETAQRTLRRDATEQGCNPRTVPSIIHLSAEEAN